MKRDKFWAALSRVLAVVTIALFVISALAPGASAAPKYKVLYRFTGGTDGGFVDAGVILDSSGNLYGTTLRGGHYDWGVVYKMTLGSNGKWKEQVIHEFRGGEDGGYVYGGVVFDASGNLYGATIGSEETHGTVYELSPRSGGGWKETILHRFGGNDGPQGGDVLFDKNGNLYDTTVGNGRKGVVFEITP